MSVPPFSDTYQRRPEPKRDFPWFWVLVALIPLAGAAVGLIR